MRFRNSPDGYGAIPQTLHWLTVGLVVLAWMLGTFDDALPKGAARAAGLFVHISSGVAILALLELAGRQRANCRCRRGQVAMADAIRLQPRKQVVEAQD